jgi:hypothetical protein
VFSPRRVSLWVFINARPAVPFFDRFSGGSSAALTVVTHAGENLEMSYVGTSKFIGCSTAALTGVAMLATSLSPASAFTLSGPALDRLGTAQVESVFWRGGGWHGGGWRRGGWGWRPGVVVGGLAAGALLGGYYGPYASNGYGPAYGDCWRDGWGRLRCY